LISVPLDTTTDERDLREIVGVAPETSAPRRSRRWRRRTVLGIGVVLVVLLAGGGAWYVFGRERARSVSTEDALSSFRKNGATAADAEGRELLGVYPATATGSESIGIPGFDESFGPKAPVTVTQGDGGCFAYRADLNSHHWRTWTFCPTDTATFALTKFESWTARKAPGLNIDSLTTYTCRTPLEFVWRSATAGDTRDGVCAGTTDSDPAVTNDAGTFTVVGTSRMRVGDETIDVVHARTTDVFTGAQTGTERDEWWLDARTGLPVKITFDLSLEGGPSDYSEHGTLVLTSTHAAR
jgi:hypothetical protein